MAILLNAQGRPEPSSEVTRRLLEIHPALFLRHFSHVGASWAICWSWPKNDARWAFVQDGSLDPQSAFDIVGYLPMDCPLDSAPAYLQRAFRDYPRAEVQQLTERVTRFNMTGASTAALAEAAIAEVLDQPDPSGTTKVRRGKKIPIAPPA